MLPWLARPQVLHFVQDDKRIPTEKRRLFGAALSRMLRYLVALASLVFRGLLGADFLEDGLGVIRLGAVGS